MKTNEFTYHSLPFLKFNIAQQAVVPFLDKDVNLIITLETATGKTALAECAFGFHLLTDTKCKVIYSAPFRGISNERYRDWTADTQFEKHGVLLSSKDSAPTTKDYEESRIIIATSESLDSKTRNIAHRQWLEKVKCVVFDEAHLLGDEDRGGSVEASLIRLADINPDMRIILLSATMGNAKEIAKWVKTLNGKETKSIQSSWRPSKIEINYCTFDDSGWDSEDKKIQAVIDLVGQKRFGEKLIVFVHSKNTGVSIVKQLSRKKVKTVFHNASISASRRKNIEKMFGDPYSGLDVLVSTSTLSSGVNL